MKIIDKSDMTLFDLLNSQIIMESYSHCKNCNGELNPVKYKALPEDVKWHFDEVMKVAPFKNKKNEFVS